MSGQSSRNPRCQSGSCEFEPYVDSRRLKKTRRPEEIHYARLWAEIEMPKLLKNSSRE